MKSSTPDRTNAASLNKRCYRFAKRCLLAVFFCIAFYFLVVLIGLVPVNNDFEPTPDGIEIFFISNPVHADVILPIATDTINWREHFSADNFSGDNSSATHVAFGWGNKKFFLETPTWADLRFSTAVQALFSPSESCMHVYLTTSEYVHQDSRSVKISRAQYERLVEFINQSFQYDKESSRIRIGQFAYSTNDAFYEARGSYSCFNTCNCWVGRAMKATGIRTAWFTPLPKTMFLYLHD